jgi:putative DNA primase/helicase
MSDNPIRLAFERAEPVDLGAPASGAESGPAASSPDAPPDPPPPEAYAEEIPPEAEGAAYPLNDYGNGQRLRLYYGKNALFVSRLGWFRWDGKRWAADEDELRVRQDAQAISDRILAEIPHIALDDWQRDALEKWRAIAADYRKAIAVSPSKRDPAQAAAIVEMEAIRAIGKPVEDFLAAAKKTRRAFANSSGNTSKISNMMAEARTLLATPVEALNSDPWAVCCKNGVVRLSMGEDAHAAAWGGPSQVPQAEILPHDRGDLITKMVGANYDPAARAPVWEAFLERVQPDPDMREFLRRWFGYCLTGITSEQKLAFFFGGGRNGKSTAVDVIARILGDYASTIPIETLTGADQRKGSDATPDLVRLPGARLVRASEPEQGQKMKEALIKALTGGEPIMIRRMMQEFVEIVPEFKLTISGNHRPEVRGADDGIWRRIMLVPFAEQIPADEVDAELPEKLWSERDGIFAWMVAGCLDWMAGGLRPPAAVVEATQEYREDSDPLRTFLTTECEITGAPDDFSRARDLGDAFNAWLLEGGFSAWGRRTTANGIKARANNVKGAAGVVYTPGKRSDTGYFGIRISDAAMDRIAQFGDQLRGSR